MTLKKKDVIYMLFSSKTEQHIGTQIPIYCNGYKPRRVLLVICSSDSIVNRF